MVNIKQFLLSLLPVIGDCPPPVFLTLTFAVAVSDSSGNFVIKVAKAKQNYKPWEFGATCAKYSPALQGLNHLGSNHFVVVRHSNR